MSLCYSDVNLMLITHINVTGTRQVFLVCCIYTGLAPIMLIPVAEWSTVRVCSQSLADSAGSNPTGGMDVCLS
jgi:hypothetical protein